MSLDRKEKVKEEVRKHAAVFLERESNRDALVSITNVDLTPDFKHATIYISVFPELKEKAVLDFSKRMRSEMHAYLRKQLRMRTIPFLDIEIDYGEKNRQHIDKLSKE